MGTESTKAAIAFLAGQSASYHNCAVVAMPSGVSLVLHGSRIAWRPPDAPPAEYIFTLAGWPALTTCNRLNTLATLATCWAELALSPEEAKAWARRRGPRPEAGRIFPALGAVLARGDGAGIVGVYRRQGTAYASNGRSAWALEPRAWYASTGERVTVEKSHPARRS